VFYGIKRLADIERTFVVASGRVRGAM